MSEQGTTNQVSLDDLKRAIAKVERYKHVPLEEALRNAVGWCAAERDAWRTAFEWRDGWNGRFMDKALSNSLTNADMPLVEEGAEGMRLIREKLR